MAEGALSWTRLEKRFRHKVKSVMAQAAVYAASQGALRLGDDRNPDGDARFAFRNGPGYRVPQDLSVPWEGPRRVLVLGSCLSEELVDQWRTSVGQLGWKTTVDLSIGWQFEGLEPEVKGPYDFVVIQLPLESAVFGTGHSKISPQSSDEFAALFEAACQRLEVTLQGLLGRVGSLGPVFVLGFLTVQQNPLGRFAPHFDLSNFQYFVMKLNERMAELATSLGATYVDFSEIVATFGRKYFQDDVVHHSSHGAFLAPLIPSPLDEERLEPLAGISGTYAARYPEMMAWTLMELAGMYRTLLGHGQVKLVITDLDDTLWRGLPAEGRSGDRIGWPSGYAEALTVLKHRGILLAIASKNDEAFVLEHWDELTEGQIDVNDFVMREIHFGHKVESVRRILNAVNVGEESTVFIDDNPVERAAVQAAFPKIRVLGGDWYSLKRILLWSPETQRPTVTEESARRTEMVKAQIERERERERLDPAAFLFSLGVHVQVDRISSGDDAAIPRALELFNKTNQFNTRGIRNVPEEFRERFRDGWTLYTCRAADRFTDYGLIACAWVSPSMIIDHMVLSFRVFGLGVDRAFVSAVAISGLARATSLGAVWQATERNSMTQTYFDELGFERASTVEPVIVYTVSTAPPPPEHVEITTNWT